MTTITCIEEEIDLNWQEEPEGTLLLIKACEEGTLKGYTLKSKLFPTCGCAYGHISGLDEERGIDLVLKRRAQAQCLKWQLTPLEHWVLHIKEGETKESSDQVRALYDLILARKPIEKGQ